MKSLKYLLGLLLILGNQLSIFGAPNFSILVESTPGLATRHGLEKLKEVLRERNIEAAEIQEVGESKGTLILVTTAAGSLQALVPGTALSEKPESFLIHKGKLEGRNAVVLLGRDDRGLMYALLEVADHVRWNKRARDPLRGLKEVSESPDVVERAVSIYTMHKRAFEERLFDEKYWEAYFDMLVQNRFNAFVVIFGYENGGYLAPVYPYLFDVEKFPEVKVTDFTAAEQERYLAAFHRMIELAHERGLKLTMGLWDHIYRGGVQSGGVSGADPNRKLPGVPAGLTSSNLMAYSAAAFEKFLKEFPELDAVQFRMHNESGLSAGQEMREFWRTMYQVVKKVRPELEFNARAKDFPDELIDLALEMGINIRICTKYWAEQMGMPFHPTHVNRQNQHDRRHGYADLLRYPKRYDMHWRLWNGGTTRVLLWGSPEWVRRFAESTHLYDGAGFEINEMLATRMEAQPHEAEPFDLLNEKYRFYNYEFERYWHFYHVFGRISYNPRVSDDVWDREFRERFGAAGLHLKEALHTASWVLPRINASIFPYHRFPTTRGWVEKQRWEDLPAYANAEGSDIQQFLSFNEAASNQLRGTFSAKLHPEQNSAWFAQTAEGILDKVRKAERSAGRSRTPEFVTTVTDLKILAHLAAYHSRRIHAALNYALFKQTKASEDLDQAITFEKEAIESWRRLVEAAGDVYPDDLAMGLRSAGLAGHWRDELAALEKGLAVLEQQRGNSPTVPAVASPRKRDRDRTAPELKHSPIVTAAPGEPLKISATVSDASGIQLVRVLYRAVTQYEDFKSLEMTRSADSYEVTIPAADLSPKWDFMYLFEVIDQKGNGKIYPDLEKETPYIVVKLKR